MAEEPHNGNAGSTGKPVFSFDTDGGTTEANGSSPGVNSGAIDPTSLTGTGEASETGKRRGRPKGSRNRSGAGTQKSAPLDVNTVEWALLGIHATLAGATKIPEFELQKEEANTLALGIANVAQHYPMVIDPKMQAWLALLMVAGGMYSTRYVAYQARIYAEQQERYSQPQPSNPVTFLHPQRPA